MIPHRMSSRVDVPSKYGIIIIYYVSYFYSTFSLSFSQFSLYSHLHVFLIYLRIFCIQTSSFVSFQFTSADSFLMKMKKDIYKDILKNLY